MRIFKKKSTWKAIGVLAAVVLLQASSAGTLVDASRDSADCVQYCNTIRPLCQAECDTDCALLFPPGQDRNSCEASCDAMCIDDSQECKARCNVNKPPISSPEP